MVLIFYIATYAMDYANQQALEVINVLIIYWNVLWHISCLLNTCGVCVPDSVCYDLVTLFVSI